MRKKQEFLLFYSLIFLYMLIVIALALNCYFRYGHSFTSFRNSSMLTSLYIIKSIIIMIIIICFLLLLLLSQIYRKLTNPNCQMSTVNEEQVK